jgi:hypothetical protein
MTLSLGGIVDFQSDEKICTWQMVQGTRNTPSGFDEKIDSGRLHHDSPSRKEEEGTSWTL